MTGRFEVSVANAGDRQEWQEFVESSGRGTLFHDLDFLDYHPAGRFDVQHLRVRLEGRLVGLMPAAVITSAEGERILRSPFGASVGGPVYREATPAEDVVGIVESMVLYARREAFSAVEMRLAPPAYFADPDQALSFALSSLGFNLRRRWLCHVIPLSADPAGVLARCSKGKARDVRAGLRRGLATREGGVEDLPPFLSLLRDTYRRHGCAPTHSDAEVADLVARLPGRVRLFLCEKNGEPLAGSLLFVLNRHAATTFYICHAEGAPAELNASAVLIAAVSERLAAEGLRSLDLGPSTFDDYRFNRGVAFFKEGMGARGWCRDEWALRW